MTFGMRSGVVVYDRKVYGECARARREGAVPRAPEPARAGYDHARAEAVRRPRTPRVDLVRHAVMGA